MNMAFERIAWNYNKKILICSHCKKEYKVSPSAAKYSKYCSLPCKYAFRKGISNPWMKGSKNPNWVGGLPNCIVCGKKLTNYMYLRCKHCNNLGELSPFWKGGITPEHLKIRMSTIYKKWRKDVFKRDKYTCVLCKAHSEEGVGHTVILNADHIKRFSTHPELRFDINNGRTLCIDCHRKTGTYGRIKYAI